MPVMVEHKGYKFAVRHNGDWFEAVDQRNGHKKVRRDIRTWTNWIVEDDGVHQELCQDWPLIDALEEGVRTLQSQMAPRRFGLMQSIQLEHAQLRRGGRGKRRYRESKDRYEAKD